MIKINIEIYNYVSQNFLRLNGEYSEIYEAVHGFLDPNLKIKIDEQLFKKKLSNHWTIVSKLMINSNQWKTSSKKSDFFQNKNNYFILTKNFESDFDNFLVNKGVSFNLSESFSKSLSNLSLDLKDSIKEDIEFFIKTNEDDKIEAAKILLNLKKKIKTFKLEQFEILKSIGIDNNKVSAYKKRLDLYKVYKIEKENINNLSDNKIRKISKANDKDKLNLIKKG